MTKVAFVNCRLFDGVKEEIVENAYMVVDEATGKLVEVGSGTKPESDKEVDLGGKYVMPGLFNVHCHLTLDPNTMDGNLDLPEAELAVRAYLNARKQLKSGVTFIRSSGDAYGVDISIQALKEKGVINDVPNIIPAGKAFSMTGGHGEMPNFSYLVDSPDEMRKSVRTNMFAGAKTIKLMSSGGVMTEQDHYEDPQLSVSELEVAVTEAHNKKLIVQAHAEGTLGIQHAIDAGVDSIEHGNCVSEEQAKEIIEKGIYIVPTLTAVINIAKNPGGVLPDWMVQKAQDMLDLTLENHKMALKQGVKFALGADSGTPFNYHDAIPGELAYMVENLDMTPFETYQTSSIHAAALCKVEDEYGTLEEGKYADFLVLDEDPLADVKAVSQVDKQVYQAGVRKY